MSKILIIPDIHGRQFWKESTQNIDEYDKVIFLGDYLDPYGFEGIAYPDAMDNFQEIIQFKRNNMDKVILLLGNHCCHYFNESFRNEGGGSRFDYLHSDTIAQVFYNNHDLFQIAYETNVNNKTYFFSHAGVLKPWFELHSGLFGKELTAEVINKTPLYQWKVFGEVSRYRGGRHNFGGIMWADYHEHDDPRNSPFDNVYQIFGHTQQAHSPVITDTYACLDCRKAFVLNDDGTLVEWKNPQ